MVQVSDSKHLPVRSYECGKNDINFGQKPWTIVHGFRPKSENFDFGKKIIPSEGASKEEQNGANFSFIVPSSEELLVRRV